MNPVYSGMRTTIFEAMSARARDTGAINLGQGFPDRDGAPKVIAAAARALTERSNQYPPMAGIPELRQAVADYYARTQSLDLLPGEVTVTSGATEALAAAILALVSPGDEVLVFQPLYDAYVPLIERAGGVARFVTLHPPEWRIDAAAMEAVITAKTRLMLLNSPLNPSGSMTSEAELAAIAEVCVRHDLLAICDEVWEALTFDGARHRPLMSMPGMRERTVKIGSAGKVFALTGWKVGWMCAAPALSGGLAKAHQFLTFTTPPNLQWAVAEGLSTQGAWIEAARAGFERSRDRLVAGLTSIELKTVPSAATYFLSIDLTASGIAMDDVAFCEWMIEHAEVVGIPFSAFYAKDAPTNLVRLCFAKQDATLDEAVARIGAALKGSSAPPAL